jgi:hypothetical protein
MNERIRELAELAVEDAAKYCQRRFNLNREENETFALSLAELIVRECLKELRYTVVDTQECRQDKSQDYQVGWEDGMFEAGETIKQHFGVEE